MMTMTMMEGIVMIMTMLMMALIFMLMTFIMMMVMLVMSCHVGNDNKEDYYCDNNYKSADGDDDDNGAENDGADGMF